MQCCRVNWLMILVLNDFPDSDCTQFATVKYSSRSPNTLRVAAN